MDVGLQSVSGETILRNVLASCRRGFLAVVVFSLAINVLMLTVPFYMLQVFDRVLSSNSTDTLILLSMIAGAALLTLAALEFVRGFILVRTGVWIDRLTGGSVLAASVSSRHSSGMSG